MYFVLHNECRLFDSPAHDHGHHSHDGYQRENKGSQS